MSKQVDLPKLSSILQKVKIGPHPFCAKAFNFQQALLSYIPPSWDTCATLFVFCDVHISTRLLTVTSVKPNLFSRISMLQQSTSEVYV